MSEKTEAQTVLSLNADEAMDYFLSSSQYRNLEMPEYFVFDEMLQSVRAAVGDKSYEECLRGGAAPERMADVNLDILMNKDGRYAVRPIMLANPVLYYFLVRELCDKRSWKVVKGLFKKFRVPHITSCALPVVPDENEVFHMSTTILNWWNAMEQRSIELSLEYRYMFVSDITNGYGTIDSRTFDRAFALMGKDRRSVAVRMSANIQTLMRAFQRGRDIGIPQGSTVFDFLSEIVLGYSDTLLHEAIQKDGITERYDILRYRDDYRIFCDNRDAVEKISYILQHVLESLNFRMNSKKTTISESIVTDSIKPDKLFYIYNTPIYNKKGADFDSFEKHLLYILMFARQYPDSGSVKTLLSDVDRRRKVV